MALNGGFQSINNTNFYNVQINCSASGSIEYGSQAAICFDYDPVNIICDRKDLSKRIIISQAQINLVSNQNLSSSLMADTNRDISVNITENGHQCFFGYIDPLQFNQPYIHNYNGIQITATDPLGALQDKLIGDVATLNADRGPWATTTLISTILEAVNINSIIYDNIFTGVQGALTGTKINTTQFFGESEDDWMNLYDVLDEICKYFNLYIIYYNGAAHITCTINNTVGVQSLLGAQGVTSFKDVAADASTALGLDTPYNKVKLTCEIEPVPSTLASISDNLYSDYNNKFWYMRDYVSPGEGDHALSGIRQLLRYGTSSYDKDYIVDYFAYVKRNNAWQFGGMQGPQGFQGHQSNGPQSYIEAAGGFEPGQQGAQGAQGIMTADQINTLYYLKNNSFRGAFVSYGRGGRIDGTDNSKQATMNLEDSLVISVNGRYHENYQGNPLGDRGFQAMNGGKTMDQMLEDNETFPVCVYKGIDSLVLTPTDGNITNYIVFSGKILLNPITQKSSINWVGYVQEGNTIYRVKEDWAPRLDGTPNMLFDSDQNIKEHCVPHPDNGDGAYYAQYWGSDSPMSSTTTGGVYGPVENDGLKKFEYKMNSMGSVSDTISKIPMLVCELRVGDKICIENPQRFGMGDSFEWVDATLAASSPWRFISLGIDPRPGDFLVGQEFDIQNNHDHYVNCPEYGMAIPIKASDNLSGPISFKIIGPYNLGYDERIHSVSSHPGHWHEPAAPDWDDNIYNILQYVDSVIISGLQIKICDDNGLISTTKYGTTADNDLVYCAEDTSSLYKNVMDEDVKICTPLTLDECDRWGIKYQNSTSYVLDSNDEYTFRGWGTGANNVKPEDCYVDYMLKEYQAPAKILSTGLRTDKFINSAYGTEINAYVVGSAFSDVYPGDSGSYRIMSYITSLRNKRTSIKFREHKTVTNTQIEESR